MRLQCRKCACAAGRCSCALAAQRLSRSKPALPAQFWGAGPRGPGTWMARGGRARHSGERCRYAGCGAGRAGAGPRCMAVRRRTRPRRVSSGRCQWWWGRPEGRGGEMAAKGQLGPGELLPSPPWPTTRGEPRHVSPPPSGHLGPPAPPLLSGLAMAPGPILPLRAPGPALSSPALPCPVPNPP